LSKKFILVKVMMLVAECLNTQRMIEKIFLKNLF